MEKGYFFNSRDGDRLYNADSFAQAYEALFTNGVFNGELQVLAVSGMRVKVMPGHAWINGRAYRNTEEKVLALQEAVGPGTRIDSVVIRLDEIEREITAVSLTGEDGTDPEPPALRREAGYHDLRIAEILVRPGVLDIGQADITDTRMDTEKCGWVAGAVKEISFEQITAQFDAFMKLYKKEKEEEFLEWFGHTEAAREAAEAAESFAHGGTGSRDGEDADNSKYFYLKSWEIYKSFSKFYGDLEGVGGLTIGPPAAVSLTSRDESVLIRWADPENLVLDGEVLAEWAGTVVIRKAGSAPEHKADGVIAVDSKTRDAYKDTGFLDSGLVNGVEYFYGIFPYTAENVYTTSKVASVMPLEAYPPAVSGISVTAGNASLTVAFSKDSAVSRVKCVYKAGSAPADSSDGFCIDSFSSGQSITGLTNGETYYFKLFSYNEKGRETASGAYSGTPVKPLSIVTFADGTTEEIKEMLEAHYSGKINVADYWAVGDERYANDENGLNDVRIIGFGIDGLSSPVNGRTKAAVTVEFTELSPSQVFQASGAARWPASDIRSALQNTRVDITGSDKGGFGSLVKSVEKTSEYFERGSGIVTETTSDRFWVPSVGETCYINSEPTYPYYRTENAIETRKSWWFRDCGEYDSGFGSYSRPKLYDMGLGVQMKSPSATASVRICFCI